MKKKSLPIGTIFVILVLSLITIGVGYGLWSETLVINGTVRTGNLDAEMAVLEVDRTDDETGALLGNGENDNTQFELKDIGQCEAVMINRHTMRVTVSNAYPSFHCFVRYAVDNIGTIPFDIYGPDYFLDGVFVGTGSFIGTNQMTVNTFPQCLLSDALQIDPAHEPVICDLHFHLEQGAEERTTYTFEVKLFARQWNEEALPPWRAP
jgi:hypothetical protein